MGWKTLKRSGQSRLSNNAVYLSLQQTPFTPLIKKKNADWDDTVTVTLLGNIYIGSTHLASADVAWSSSHSTDILWDSNLLCEAAEGLLHSCCEATPTLTWQHVWVLLEEKFVGPPSQAFGTQKPALLEICLCLDPSIVPLDLWQNLTLLPGQV